MMAETKKDELLHDHNHDGVDRRGFLKCMAWAGTGALCVMQGGVLKSYALGSAAELRNKGVSAGELSFVQISDSHMGFNKAANPDVVGTLKAAVDKINALPSQPEFMLHTGYQPSFETRRIRHRRSASEERGPQRCFLCSRRARRIERRWQTIPGSLRKRR
jgi:hypothetical protein